MSIYTGAILLTELLMLAMGYHVLYYPGFTKVEKRWYLFTFIAIFFCAGAEFLSIHFDARGAAFSLPLTILTVLQFSISPLLPAFFVGALGMYRQAIAAGTVFSSMPWRKSFPRPLAGYFITTRRGSTFGVNTISSMKGSTSSAFCS